MLSYPCQGLAALKQLHEEENLAVREGLLISIIS